MILICSLGLVAGIIRKKKEITITARFDDREGVRNAERTKVLRHYVRGVSV